MIKKIINKAPIFFLLYWLHDKGLKRDWFLLLFYKDKTLPSDKAPFRDWLKNKEGRKRKRKSKK